MKALKEMNLLDDFLFNAVVSYNERGVFFSRELLKTIFRREFGELIITPQKPYYGLDTCYHGIRLDVQMEEQMAFAMPNTVFDIEPEKDRDDKNSLPKRTRFYHARIDARSLKAGEDYEQLKKVIVIMITPFDPFGYNRMIYTVRRRCDEVPEMEFDDGAKTIFLYTKGIEDGCSQELKELLHYMENSKIENVTNKQLGEIHKIVEAVKQDAEVTKGYMKMCEYEKKWERKGIEKGSYQILISLVTKGIITVREAAEELLISEKEFEDIMKKESI